MKILIFSDTHLTHKFDKELFDYIAKLVKSADQVIINGDFWDAYLTTFDEFCNSKWKKLFPILKSKSTIYIHGNHDKAEFNDDRENYFSSVQLEDYSFKSGNKSFYVVHGHIAAPTCDGLSIFKNPNISRPFYKAIVLLIEKIKIFKIIFDLIDHRLNKQHIVALKQFANDTRKKDEIFLVAHSHLPEFNLEEKFISTAVLQKINKSYCFIENGEIEFYSKSEAKL